MTDKTVDQEVLEFQQSLESANLANEASKATGAAAILESEHLADRDEMNRIFGQIQMAQTLSDFTTVVALSKLAEVKKSKGYRSLKGIKAYDKHGELIPNVGTWDGFCKALRTSCQKVDEDLANLELFGEASLENLQALGIGYREMRKLRKMPEEDRVAIIEGEAIQIGDKEEIVSLIEDMVAKHSREKQELADQLQRTKSEQEANQRLLADKDQKINTLDRELRRDFTPDEEKQRRLDLDSSQQNKLKDKEFTCISALNELSQVVDEVLERDDRSEYLEEALYGSLRGVLRHALMIGREHQIDPVHVLGVQLDVEKLDSMLDQDY